jgi:ornithine cyclodeaminase/alanine dehydrogenase-like protein (mu-crystallin family)
MMNKNRFAVFDIDGTLIRWQLYHAVVDLQALCRREHPGRQSDAEVTVFKSVGAALEDLAAAILVYESS